MAYSDNPNGTLLSYFNDTPRAEWRISDFCMLAGVTKSRLIDEPPGSELYRARMLLESVYEERLNRRGNSGDILGIKQFGWGDKPEEKKDAGKLSAEGLLKVVAGEKY